MFEREINLIGEDNYLKLKNSNILVIGVGGVGGYAVETLIRSGIENITLVDYDNIDISNIPNSGKIFYVKDREIINKNDIVIKAISFFRF